MNKPQRTYEFLKQLPKALHEIRLSIQSLDSNNKRLTGALDGQSIVVNSLRDDLETIKQKYADLHNEIVVMKKDPINKKVGAAVNKSELQADNHSLDSYYVAFEEKFRGSEEVIYNRLKKSYSSLLKSIPKENKQLTFIDIGCGRGELLRLYQELGLRGTGIDLNKTMVDRSKANGFNAIQANALDYLREQPANTLGGISGIHIVEHIPFESLLELLQEAYRVVAPGGFVLFETPNAENVTVGSFTFWYDSSHLKPVPPDVLNFMLGYVGFNKTKILRLHPSEELTMAQKSGKLTQAIAQRLFGPRDYTAIGYKASKATPATKK